MRPVSYAGFTKIPSGYGNTEYINANNVTSIKQASENSATIITYTNGEKDYFNASADEIATALNESKICDNVNGTNINFTV